MNELILFILGIIFVSFVQPIVEHTANYITHILAKFINKEELEIQKMQLELNKHALEVQDDGNRIGFDMSNNVEYIYEDDDDIYPNTSKKNKK